MDDTVFPTTDIGLLYGIQEYVVGIDPAPGVQLKYVLPGGYYHRLKLWYFHVSTSATVAARQIGVSYNTGSSTQGIIRQSTSQTASTDVDYTVIAGFGNITMNLNAQCGLFPFPDVWLAGGGSVSINAIGYQAGDATTNVSMMFERIERDKLLEHYDPLALLEQTRSGLAAVGAR